MQGLAVTDDDFDDEVLRSDLPVLVDFWAPGCRPCVVMAAVADSIAAELEGRVRVVTANVHEAQEAALRHGVVRVPSFLVVSGGKVEAQLSGLRSREELLDALAPVLQPPVTGR